MNGKQAQQASERDPAPPRRHTDTGSRRQVAAGLSPMWPGLPWMGPWLEFWTSMWTGWLGQGLRHPLAGAVHRRGGMERRHEEGLPWMPKVETTVIPLRRRTDPPGQQADRISMRMQVPTLPWLPGGNVISIDTVVPRVRADDEASEPGGGENANP